MPKNPYEKVTIKWTGTNFIKGYYGGVFFPDHDQGTPAISEPIDRVMAEQVMESIPGAFVITQDEGTQPDPEMIKRDEQIAIQRETDQALHRIREISYGKPKEAPAVRVIEPESELESDTPVERPKTRDDALSVLGLSLSVPPDKRQITAAYTIMQDKYPAASDPERYAQITDAYRILTGKDFEPKRGELAVIRKKPAPPKAD